MSFYLNDAAKILLVMYDYNLTMSSTNPINAAKFPHTKDGEFAMNISMIVEASNKLYKDYFPIESSFEYDRVLYKFVTDGKMARMNVNHLLGDLEGFESEYYILTNRGKTEAEELKKKVVDNPKFKFFRN